MYSRIRQISLFLYLPVMLWGRTELAAQKVPDEGKPQAVTMMTPYRNDRLGSTICNMAILGIPDNSPAGVSSTIEIQDMSTVDTVSVDLSMSHTWVGDLIVSLEHEGETVFLMDQPGLPASTFGCSGNNVFVTFEDGAALPVENVCPATNPVLNGSFQPVTPLASFKGTNLVGTWTLTVSDNIGGDTGTLDGWCLFFGYIEDFPFADLDSIDVFEGEIRLIGECNNMDLYVSADLWPYGSRETYLLYTSIDCVGELTLPIPPQYFCGAQFFVSFPGGPVEPVGPVGLGPMCTPALSPLGMTTLIALLAGTATVMMYRRRRQAGDSH